MIFQMGEPGSQIHNDWAFKRDLVSLSFLNNRLEALQQSVTGVSVASRCDQVHQREGPHTLPQSPIRGRQVRWNVIRRRGFQKCLPRQSPQVQHGVLVNWGWWD